jgi:hypothetical protein
MMLPVAAGAFCAVLISLPAWVLMAHAIPKGAPSLLKAWGLGFGIKILLGGAGIWAIVRVADIPVRPFLWTLLIVYMLALAAEIWWAVRRIRRIYSSRENQSSAAQDSASPG